MDYKRREEIFAKETLSIEDMMELTGKTYSTASTIIRAIKRKYNRLDIDGIVHILDYMEYFGIDPKDPGVRYTTKEQDGNYEPIQTQQPRRRSLCV